MTINQIHDLHTARRQCAPVAITDDHRRLLDRLHRLIPDLDPDDAASLQRIFELGLLTLTAQAGATPDAEPEGERTQETETCEPRES